MPAYRSVPELGSVLTTQMRADRTAVFTNDATVAAQPPIHLVGEGGLRISDAGFAMQTHQLFNTPGASVADLWVVVLPGLGYLRTPPQLSSLPADRPWVGVHTMGTDGASMRYGPLVDAVRYAVDPTSVLTEYGDALSLGKTEPSQLDGTPVEHYQVRLDVARGQLTSPDPVTKQLLNLALAHGVSTFDFQFWLDAHNRLRQMTATAPMPPASTTVTTTARYSGWAEPVTIAAPSPTQVSAGN